MKEQDEINISVSKKTGVPVTEVEYDRSNKEYFFVAVISNEDCRYTDKDKKKLLEKRKEIVIELKEIIKEEIKKKTNTNEVAILKKSKEKTKGSYFKSDVKIGNTEYMQMRRKIILEARLRGLEKPEIVSVIREEFDIGEGAIAQEISNVDKEIKEYSIITHEEVLLSHINKYEELYKKFREEGMDSYAMRALRCKESIMGLHDQTVNIQINNFLDKEFDIKLLNKDEQKKLKTLLNKIIIK